MLQMTIKPRSLLVIAGLPGSGKSTLLRCTQASAPVTVLDSDQMRDRVAAVMRDGTPYSRYRPLVHVLHRLRVTLIAVSARGPVVVHDPATGAATRTWLMLLGGITGRARHLLWVDCTPEEAAAGQRSRGRILRRKSFSRHLRRLPHVRALLRAGPPRGWCDRMVVDRPSASRGLRLVVE
jgi:predicted kinase